MRRWKLDTLLVQTKALNDRTWVDEVGTSHSDALQVAERFRRLNRDTLEVEFLFEELEGLYETLGRKETLSPGA